MDIEELKRMVRDALTDVDPNNPPGDCKTDGHLWWPWHPHAEADLPAGSTQVRLCSRRCGAAEQRVWTSQIVSSFTLSK